MSGFSYFIPWMMVCVVQVAILEKMFGLLGRGRGAGNADISALWSWVWRGFRNMLINILIR